MIKVSNEFRRSLTSDRRDYHAYVGIVLADGTNLGLLDDSDLWEGGLKIEDSVSASEQFTIGSCIINKLTFSLNNIYDKFSAYDFGGARVTVYLGLTLSGNKEERLCKGVFWVEDPQYDGTTITLECLDNMSLFDKDYGAVQTVYPATIKTIVKDICDYCCVSLATESFDNCNYVVSGRIDDEALTCRQVLAYCAQIAGCFGRCNTHGDLELRWFEQGRFENSLNLDGGFFDDKNLNRFDSGDAAEGGDFELYTENDVLDGGNFEELENFHHLFSMNGFNVSTDDVVITGIEVTDEFDETEIDKKQTVLVGESGYVLSISGNKFIQKGKAGEVAEYLGERLIGLRFRPMSAQILNDPTVEAGDLAFVTDHKQRTYQCLITSTTFNLGGFMSVSCDAEKPAKNSAKQYSEMTQAIVEARKAVQRQASGMASVMTQSFGIFKTELVEENGTVIYYMHNKQNMAESQYIWRFGENLFEVSDDGGESWKAGLDENGTITLNVLSVIGIQMDWLKEGTLLLGGSTNQRGVLRVQDEEENEIGYWDNTGLHVKEAKTGIIEFSDGRFLKFENGILVDGNVIGE